MPFLGARIPVSVTAVASRPGWGLALLLLPSLVLLAACGDDNGGDGDLREMTFMAGFTPQANLPFAAVYVADAEGFFVDEGLSVDIQHSPGQEQHMRLLLDGAVDVVTGTAAQAIRRGEEELPLSAVALFGQRGDQGYVARADAGIAGPEDFAGHSVGYKAGVVPAEFHALMRAVGMSEDDVDLVSVGFDARVFIEGQVDVYPVFLNNEPNLIRREGVEINVIDPHEYGVPTLGLAYLVHNDTLAGDEALVEDFLRATMRAAHWIEEHPGEAIEIVLQHAEGADPEHQRFLLDADLDAAQREDGMGRASLEQWSDLEAMLREFDVIEQPVAVEGIWHGGLIDGLYERGELPQ